MLDNDNPASADHPGCFLLDRQGQEIANSQLFLRILNLAKQLIVHFQHAARAQNEEADALARLPIAEIIKEERVAFWTLTKFGNALTSAMTSRYFRPRNPGG